MSDFIQLSIKCYSSRSRSFSEWIHKNLWW